MYAHKYRNVSQYNESHANVMGLRYALCIHTLIKLESFQIVLKSDLLKAHDSCWKPFATNEGQMHHPNDLGSKSAYTCHHSDKTGACSDGRVV